MVGQVGLLKWTVTVKMDNIEGEYEVEALRYYRARVLGVSRFLKEFDIPGRPYEYITGRKRGLVEITVRCQTDERVAVEPYPVEEE